MAKRKNKKHTTREVIYDEGGNKIVKIYNKDQKLIEEKYYNDKGYIASQVKYDKNGREIEKNIRFRNGSIKEKKTFGFDKYGNVILRKKYGRFGKIISSYRELPDRENISIEIISYDSRGRFSRKWIEEYDSKGELIKRYTYRNRKTIDYCNIFNSAGLDKTIYYDYLGNIIRTTDNDSDCSYDANGNMIEYILYDNDFILSNERYEYDKSNNRIGKRIYNRYGGLTRYNKYFANGLDDKVYYYEPFSTSDEAVLTDVYEYDEFLGTKVIKTYDKEGNLDIQKIYKEEKMIAWSLFNVDGRIIASEEYEYDEDGKLKMKKFDDILYSSEAKISLDKDWNKEMIWYDEDGAISKKYLWTKEKNEKICQIFDSENHLRMKRTYNDEGYEKKTIWHCQGACSFYNELVRR